MDTAPTSPAPRQLADAVALDPSKVINPDAAALYGGIASDAPVLLVLAAGKGTRFGQDPKCIQPVQGTPLARHSIDAFRRFRAAPVVCLVGYRADDVAAALGPDNVYVRSANPAGGTGQAAYEAFSVAALLERNPLLVITMGDRIVTPAVYQRLIDTHRAGPREAELTLLTALYEPPRHVGKGRVLRDAAARVVRIVEQRDIDAIADGAERRALHDLAEGNCPLYAVRAATLHRHLRGLANANAQGQYYLTDIVEGISRAGGDVRTITTTVADPEYDLLCSDVTRPMDLALLEGILSTARGLLFPGEAAVDEAARRLRADRPAAQLAAIARQLRELLEAARREKLGFRADQPVALGVAGGRLRVAFMHPDMVRFYGPAWQMPMGAGTAEGNEQIVVLAQGSDDRRIHLYPTNPKYREAVNFVPSDDDVMYPGEGVSDWHTYEAFGTRMSESLLLSLGYFSDEELERRRAAGQPLPPPALWVSSNMRRPFSLVGNAIASLRTLREGNLGAHVQRLLGRDGFQGLRLVAAGGIPQGGFSSSSALTVATKNAINALLDLGIPPDLLVHLACQAEYGTGVRAGSLDQATEQKGRAGEGTLISSNPRDNYRVIGTYPVPADRFRVIFPYTVDRDRAAWRWSWGFYAGVSAPGRLTTGEMRKMTGKAAELAAILVRLPLDTDFFKLIEDDLVADGRLERAGRAAVAAVLRQLPLCASQADLQRRVEAGRAWYMEQLIETQRLDASAAARKTDAVFAGLFTGWQDPSLRRATADGRVVEEVGAPLRAMVAYLFGEVATNFHLIHHPADWIATVTRSQRGDRCVDIDPARLPPREAMEGTLDWERGVEGPDRLDRWLERAGATPFDFNRGLDDATLAAEDPPDPRRMAGSNFFRGLALIDLAEAMLHRAFGADAVAVRVNAAGQGDFFQVHVDTQKTDIEAVRQFLRAAFYARFGFSPDLDFVETHPGGGAVGARLPRFDALPALVRRLEA